MKYNPPIGGAANDPYVDGNPGAGIAGSAVPAAAVEFAQREIVNVILNADIVPSNGDLSQLYEAIQALIAAAVGGIPPPALPAPDQPGTRRETYCQVAQTGWILMDDGTVGSGASGATHANDLYVNLYNVLWAMDNTACPVTGGRGANAAADWAAHKPINLPLVKGRSGIGAGTGSGLTNRILGRVYGEEAHTQSTGEIGTHAHHGREITDNTTGGTNTGIVDLGSGSDNTITNTTGSSTPFNVVHPVSTVNYEIKY